MKALSVLGAILFSLLHASGVSAACGANAREVAATTDHHYLETNDILSDTLATVHICGGCKVVTGDAVYKYNIQVRWGDGSASAVKEGESGDIAYDAHRGQITGSHKYLRQVDPPQSIIAVAQFFCNDEGHDPKVWQETVASNCETGISGCIESTSVVGVYDPKPPKAAVISHVVHGAINKGALTVFYATLMPKSGMHFDASCSDPRIKIVGPLVVPDGQSSWDFDIDAQGVPLSEPATIWVTSAHETKIVDFTIH